MTKDNIPQPDPAWDYYQTWHSLHQIKDKIDEALKLMNDIESSTLKADEAIRSLLNPACNRLILIVRELSDNDKPPDES
ncbi:hypothetical protein [uncultured Nostoc sp.]|uniref:hypothetical protein n=1 Tax=uncultured Nostoc sp. TaxID=340711 RepID=UPI0035CC5E56